MDGATHPTCAQTESNAGDESADAQRKPEDETEHVQHVDEFTPRDRIVSPRSADRNRQKSSGISVETYRHHDVSGHQCLAPSGRQEATCLRVWLIHDVSTRAAGRTSIGEMVAFLRQKGSTCRTLLRRSNRPCRCPGPCAVLSASSLSIQTLLQLLEPVLDENHAGRRRVRIAGCAVLEHQEPLAVRGHVVRARGKWSHARRLAAVGWIAFLSIPLLSWAQVADDSREKTEKVTDILSALQAEPGKRIADIGAGEGFYSIRIARAVGPTGRVTAVDVSEKHLEKLRARIQQDQVTNVDVVVGAVDDPRLPTGTFDAVLIYTPITK
jgi:hypothetical protein